MTKMWTLLTNTFLKKCFDISRIILSCNQTIDQISHWNLKPITIKITTDITITIFETGFYVKKQWIQISCGVFFLFTGIECKMDVWYTLLPCNVLPCNVLPWNDFYQNQYDFFQVHR